MSDKVKIFCYSISSSAKRGIWNCGKHKERISTWKKKRCSSPGTWSLQCALNLPKCDICANDIHYILFLLGGKTEVWIPANKLLSARVMLYISKDTIAVTSDVLFYSADAQVQNRGGGCSRKNMRLDLRKMSSAAHQLWELTCVLQHLGLCSSTCKVKERELTDSKITSCSRILWYYLSTGRWKRMPKIWSKV